MTSRGDLEPESERAIEEFLDAAGEEVDVEPVVRPPFAAVLARARRLDAALGRASPPPRPSPARGGRDAALTDELAPFVAAARDEAELDVSAVAADRRPGLLHRRGASITRWVALGGTLAAAAAVLLWSLLDVERARRAEPSRGAGQAMDQVDVERRVLEAETGGEPLGSLVRRPRASYEGARTSDAGPVVPDEPVPLEPVVLPDEPVPLELVREQEPPPHDPPASRPAVEPREHALRRLDDEAAARLAAGDAAGAEAAYRALVRQGGRSGLVELAYGDLFTLAHQRGDARAQVALWREYLRKFPRGRFADDARAGLCRHAQGDEAAACWQRYLDEFPTGAYHRQAERMRTP